MLMGQLEAFVVVAREGTMRRASELLHLSQPALSARVVGLERAMGSQLFDRTKRGMTLTPVGEALLPHAVRVTEAAKAGMTAVRDFQLGRAGEIAIGATAAISSYVLPEILARFRVAHPTVRLAVRTDTSEGIDELVVRGDVKVGIVREHRVDHLSKESLYSEELVLVGKPGGADGVQACLTADDLREATLILLDRRWASSAVLLDLFSANGDPPVDTIAVESVDLAKHLACRGVGYAMLPMTAVASELESGRLARVMLSEQKPVLRRVLLVERSDAAAWEPLDELKSLLRRVPEFVPGTVASANLGFPGLPGHVSAWMNNGTSSVAPTDIRPAQ